MKTTGENKGYILRCLTSIDQTFNTVAGGDMDCTISARVGFFTKSGRYYSTWFWWLMRTVINFSFFPFDGYNHCQQAYLLDKDEKFRRGSDLGLLFMLLVIIIPCLSVAVIGYLIYFIKLVLKPYKIFLF